MASADAFGNAIGNSLVTKATSQTPANGGGDRPENQRSGADGTGGAEGLVPDPDNPHVLIGSADRLTDLSEYEYNLKTGEFGSRFPIELVSTPHLIASNDRLSGVPDEISRAFSDLRQRQTLTDFNQGFLNGFSNRGNSITNSFVGRIYQDGYHPLDVISNTFGLAADLWSGAIQGVTGTVDHASNVLNPIDYWTGDAQQSLGVFDSYIGSVQTNVNTGLDLYNTGQFNEFGNFLGGPAYDGFLGFASGGPLGFRNSAAIRSAVDFGGDRLLSGAQSVWSLTDNRYQPGSFGSYGGNLFALPSSRSALEIRNLTGRASGGLGLPDVTGSWLKGTDGNLGLIPGQVARDLNGRTFNSFDEFRGAFWQSVANDPNLSQNFSKQNISRISQGLAPIAPQSQHLGLQSSYILHHRTPIQHGGAVYDLNNLVVVTPRLHVDIIDGKFHFGRN